MAHSRHATTATVSRPGLCIAAKHRHSTNARSGAKDRARRRRQPASKTLPTVQAWLSEAGQRTTVSSCSPFAIAGQMDLPAGCVVIGRPAALLAAKRRKTMAGGAGVYTIWDDAGGLVYAGIAGRNPAGKGLASRLRSHASGRRSGDQFCVYVADHYVLRELTREQIEAIRDSRLSMDALVRSKIRLGVRVPVHRGRRLPDGAANRERHQGRAARCWSTASQPIAALQTRRRRSRAA